MSADSPASGLPQEAVDAAAKAIELRTIHLTADPQLVQFHPVVWAEAALTAALPSLLAAERAKVAALQQAVDKVRALVDAPVERPSIASDIYADGHQDGYELAMTRVHRVLPDVQADDRGTDFRDEKCANCNGVARNCADVFPVLCCGKCSHPVVLPVATPATPCADCGTTRTICDAGLNTYDSRCCEQCGHGVT